MLLHKTKAFHLAFLAAVTLVAVQSASADPLILTVTPSIGPVFSSPSFGTYAANALYALENGLTTAGNPAKPTYYSALGITNGNSATPTVQTQNILSTTDSNGPSFAYNSWNGAVYPLSLIHI